MGASETQRNNISATILEIQRMSTEDGPGIRTTVFFKGCTLKCRWCHNPESISPHPQIHWIENRCIGCRTCLTTCPEKALTMTDTGNHIDRKRCNGCGMCADACPAAALERLGHSWHVDDLATELLKDRSYFEKSGGGITLGGGEPTLQWVFAEALLKKMKKAGIHTALDTCGLCSEDALSALLPHVDLLLFDLKEMNAENHGQFTGARNDTIIGNLLFVSDRIRSKGCASRIWIRTPVIPGATATDENIRQIGRLIAEKLDGCVDRWELNAFNNLCKDKYARLGMDWAYKDHELLSRLEMEKMAAIARNSGVHPEIVLWNGSTRLDD